ncbi:MAG TPA: hypothetical protein VGN26_01300 [Armatimonadota bacterium]
MLSEREQLHRLVDMATEEQASRWLRRCLAELPADLRPFLQAPEDDEPVTEAEAEAVAEAREESARGDTLSMEEVFGQSERAA